MAGTGTFTTRQRVRALSVLLAFGVVGAALAVAVPVLDRDRALRSLTDALVPAQVAARRYVVEVRGSSGGRPVTTLPGPPAEITRLTPRPVSVSDVVAAVQAKDRPELLISAEALAGELDQRVSAVRRSADAAGRRGVVSAPAAVLALVLVIGLVRRRFDRLVLEPLVALGQAGRRLALGVDEAPASVPQAVAEVRENAEVLELLRGRLADQGSALRAAGEALRQRAPIVSAIRQELAPPELPAVPGTQVAVRQIPAEGVLAGDWYDVVQLDGDFVGVCMGDVAGHGAETGILALQTKQFVVSALRMGLDPGKSLSWTAEHIGVTPERFVTCLVAIVNTSTGSCRYASAGHPPPLVVEAAGGVRELRVTGPLLGPYAGTWGTEETTLTAQEVLLCYTDGLTEMRDEGLRELGVDGLSRLLADQPADVVGLVDRCVEVAKERGAGSPRDDLTVLAFARTPSP